MIIEFRGFVQKFFCMYYYSLQIMDGMRGEIQNCGLCFLLATVRNYFQIVETGGEGIPDICRFFYTNKIFGE